MTPEHGLPPTPIGTPVESAEDAHVTLELLISNLLRYGVLLSVSLVATGALLTFFHHPDYLTSSDSLERVTRPEEVPHSLPEVVAGLSTARGRALTMMGLLLLISIPVTRVALSLIVFRSQRDRHFVRITAAVLVLLVLSFALGQTAG